jgi:hypothetical protein
MSDYKKIAKNIRTVGELMDVLSTLDKNNDISLSGVEGFAIAQNTQGHVLMDEPNYIDELCEE